MTSKADQSKLDPRPRGPSACIPKRTIASRASLPPIAEMPDELRDLRRTQPARWIIWEGPPLRETVEKLEAMGLGSVVFDPAGNRPSEGDFLSVMQANVAALRLIGDPPEN